MKAAALLLILATLAACAPAAAPDLRASLTRAQIDRSPQPLMLAEIAASGVRATLVPAGTRDGVTTWRTGQNQTLSFRDGVLVATRGLADDLMSADVSGTIAALNGGPQADYPRLLTYLDGQGQTVFRAMSCQMGPPVSDVTVSFGITFPTTRRDEVCATSGLTVTNRYHADPGGEMRRSEQWVGPGLGTLVTERLTR